MLKKKTNATEPTRSAKVDASDSLSTAKSAWGVRTHYDGGAAPASSADPPSAPTSSFSMTLTRWSTRAASIRRFKRISFAMSWRSSRMRAWSFATYISSVSLPVSISISRSCFLSASESNRSLSSLAAWPCSDGSFASIFSSCA